MIPSGVSAQPYPAGSEFQVSTYTMGNQYETGISMDAEGNFVVAWHGSQDGNGDSAQGQRFDSSGGAVGSEWQEKPTVAARADGDFVVVWQGRDDQDGSASGIFAQRFFGARAIFFDGFESGDTSRWAP